MKTFTALACLLLLWSPVAIGQQTSFQDSLLDHAVGSWLLHGTIDNRETTHDVDVAWVLGHQYIQIHEISHEKDSSGVPAYEAIVYIGWDAGRKQYTCLWLDITGSGGLSADAVGRAERAGDELPFVFSLGPRRVFRTTFSYHRSDDTWTWRMDDEQQGTLTPFARVELRKKP